MLQQKKNGSNLPAVFSYGANNQLTVIMVENQPYFAVKEVCSILELSHTNKAVKALDDDERKVIPGVDIKGRKNRILVVNESGLYNLIFRSNKPEAKQFRKWVTNEVLPKLRQQGSYQVPGLKAQEPPKILVQPVPDIFTRLKQEFNEKVRTIVINGTTYFKLIDVEKLIYSGHATNQITRQTVKRYIKEGDAITILNNNSYHNYWVNYFALKGMLERVNNRKGFLLHMALFEQGEPLPAPVLPESQVRVVINKLLKGREHGCTI